MFANLLAPAEAVPQRPTRRAWGILLLLTALVAALHLVGLDWHLPHHPQGDEKVLWLQVAIARGEEVTPAERLLARCYPSLLGRAADALVSETRPAAPGDVAALREAAVHELYGIRLLVAILSAGIVPATWLVARWFLRERWAFLAAALASTSTIAVWYSSMARPHAVVVVFLTATVAASLRARATGRIRDFLLAGAFAALAVGTLHSGACACAAVAAAWAWNARPRFGAPLVGAVLAAVLVLVSLFVFLRGEPLPDLAGGEKPGNALLSFFGMGVHNVDAGFFDGGGFVRFARAMRDWEPILALGAAVGIACLIGSVLRGGADRTRRAVFWTVAAQPLTHLLLFGAYSDSFQRFWLPLIPYLAILAVVGAVSCWNAAPVRVRPFVAGLCTTLALAQLGIALQIARLRVRDDTHELAAHWIETHPANGPFFIGPTVRVPLVARDPAYRAELLTSRMYFVPWVLALTRLDDATRDAAGIDLRDLPLRRLDQRNQLELQPARFVDGLGKGCVFLERIRDDRRKMFRVLREELVRRGEPLAAFDPRPPTIPGAQPIDYMLDGPGAPEAWFAWSLVWVERLGPSIEVFSTGN
ncbi:MAG: glycosyltransferase family 39 protein [Planctomycetota bacterium]|nr:glycosyltransferase family 39 protein [Planctomycetota bacterium]